MDPENHRTRLFSGPLDRSAFSVYFLGAIVPLVALAVVVDTFALPTMKNRASELALMAVVVFAALLSLGAFVTLRHMTRSALRRMEREGERLAGLLQSSTALSAAQDVSAALATTARCAVDLAAARAAFVFLKGDEEGAPSLSGSAGRDADSLYTAHAGAVEELVRTAVEGGQPAVRSADDGSFAVAAVPLPGGVPGALALVKTAPSAYFAPGELDALSTLAGLAAVAFHNADLRDSQRNFFSHVTDMLVSAVDSHLGFHRGHGQRVAALANRLGRALELDEAALQRLHFAALLHDIGMLKIDVGQEASRETFEKHCSFGYRILARIRLWKDIAPIVYHHHEWFDGSGYPEGKVGHDIPLESRIIAVCDAFDTMTSQSSYRSPMPLEQALAELERCSNTQFDPELVAVFRGLARDGLIDAGPPPKA